MESFAFILMGIFGTLLVVFFVLMGFVIKSRIASYSTGQKLASTMNLKSVSSARMASLAWFEGQHKGRPFALRIIGKYAGKGIENRNSYISVLRIAVAVHTKGRLGFKARFLKKDTSINVYDVDSDVVPSGEVFTERPSTAFWEFVQRGYPVGFQDGDLRFSPGTRELVVGERHALAGQFALGDTVLTGVPTVLIHDHIRPNRTAVQVQELLDEMQEVAEALEEGY